ncbi:MAG: FeoB-associated Cys-rich membrane protein [Bacteroidales bacterium]
MVQEIITYIILIATVVFVAYKIYETFAKQKTGCDGCASSCNNDCALHDLKQEIEKHKVAR